MPSLLAKLGQAADELYPRKGKNAQGPPGNFSLGTGYIGGPLFTDRFQSKRAPTPWQLVESYKSLIYACVAKNAMAVARVPLRLYADDSRTQPGQARVHQMCDPHPISRRMFIRFREDPWCEYTRVAPKTVDDVSELRNHPILTLLDNPDPWGYFDRSKLIQLLVRYCDVVGLAYLSPEGGGRGRLPNWIWPLYSQYVLPIRRIGSPLIDRYQYFADQIPFDALLRFRLSDSLRDPYAAGYSPTYAAIEYANLEDAFVAIQEQLFGRGARPSLLVSPKSMDGPIGEPDASGLARTLTAGHPLVRLVVLGYSARRSMLLRLVSHQQTWEPKCSVATTWSGFAIASASPRPCSRRRPIWPTPKRLERPTRLTQSSRGAT